MSRLFAAFLLGIIFTVIIFCLFDGRGTSMDSVSALKQDTSLIDYVIDTWAERNDGSYSLAGFPSKIELPDARPGYFPDTVIALAKLSDSLYNIPYGVTLCQYALESNWGRSNLSLSNYFGLTFAAVKPYMQSPRWAYRKDLVIVNGRLTKKQPVQFAEFSSIAECFDTHARYLSSSKRYAKAFRTQSVEKFAQALADAGYAQDPEYALKLITIMRRYQLN